METHYVGLDEARESQTALLRRRGEKPDADDGSDRTTATLSDGTPLPESHTYIDTESFVRQCHVFFRNRANPGVAGR